jgi:hypothetical protein
MQIPLPRRGEKKYPNPKCRARLISHEPINLRIKKLNNLSRQQWPLKAA